MITYRLLLIAIVSMVIATCTTPLVRRLALRFQFVDQPSGNRHHHSTTPLLGGVALYGAVVISLCLTDRRTALELAPILLGASWIFVFGLLDDRRQLSPSAKLVIQLVAAVLVVASGVSLRLPVPCEEILNPLLTVLFILTVTNACNLLDNMDGVAAGAVSVAAGWLVLLAYSTGQFELAALAAAMVGACAGFLVYNLPPARIFMGDAGSLLLGFLLAALAIDLHFAVDHSKVTTLAPLLVLGVPLFDTTLVVISRLRRGLNPMTTPGRDHVPHRLLRRGLRESTVVLQIVIAGVVLGAVGVFVAEAGMLLGSLAIATVVAIAVLGLVYFERGFSR